MTRPKPGLSPCPALNTLALDTVRRFTLAPGRLLNDAPAARFELEDSKLAAYYNTWDRYGAKLHEPATSDEFRRQEKRGECWRTCDGTWPVCFPPGILATRVFAYSNSSSHPPERKLASYYNPWERYGTQFHGLEPRTSSEENRRERLHTSDGIRTVCFPPGILATRVFAYSNSSFHAPEREARFELEDSKLGAYYNTWERYGAMPMSLQTRTSSE
ncbi:hypothetical protein F5Y17DRAFT_454505 [Xylariaceae sp. FL0594]|nr:hypothetical protein F5Y17DRAFT_454505 [Xylariaceae sp. FL0594]